MNTSQDSDFWSRIFNLAKEAKNPLLGLITLAISGVIVLAQVQAPIIVTILLLLTCFSLVITFGIIELRKDSSGHSVSKGNNQSDKDNDQATKIPIDEERVDILSKRVELRNVLDQLLEQAKNTLIRLGEFEEKLDDDIQAEERYNQALYISEHFELPIDRGDIWLRKGLILVEKEASISEAEKSFNEALSFAKTSGNKQLEASALKGLASTYRKLKKYPEAFKCCNASEEIWQNLNHHKEASVELHSIRTLYKYIVNDQIELPQMVNNSQT